MKKKKKRIIIPIVIIVLIIAGLVTLFMVARNARGTSVAVSEVKVEKKDLKQYLSVTGTVASKSKKEYFAQNGKIKEIKVKVGDKVSVDDLLAIYDLTDIAKRTLSDEIKSETAGTVTQINADAGTSVTSGPAVTVENLDSLEIQAYLGRFESLDVKKGQKVIIYASKKTYNGKVSFVAPVAELAKGIQTGDAMLRITVDFDTKTDFIAGFDADMDILTAEVKNVLVVPGESVRTDSDGKSYVFIIKNNTALQKEVKTGLQSDTETQIISGLSTSDKIIQSPGVLVTDGTKVYLQNN